MTQTYAKSLTLPATQEGMSGQEEDSNTTVPQKTKTMNKKRSKSSTLDRIYKRTVFMKGVKYLDGREIKSILTRDRTCTAISVNSEVIKRNHLEIICNTPG